MMAILATPFYFIAAQIAKTSPFETQRPISSEIKELLLVKKEKRKKLYLGSVCRTDKTSAAAATIRFVAVVALINLKVRPDINFDI